MTDPLGHGGFDAVNDTPDGFEHEIDAADDFETPVW
jgi:hypothetical protein